MKLETIIFDAGGAVGHLVSGLIFVISLDNAINESYQFATMGVITTAYMQYKFFKERERQKYTQEFIEKVNNKYLPEMNSLIKRFKDYSE